VCVRKDFMFECVRKRENFILECVCMEIKTKERGYEE